MSTQNDLLDGNDSNLERLSSEAPEQSDMCLNWQDDVENNFPNCEPDACGVGGNKMIKEDEVLSNEYKTVGVGYSKKFVNKN